MEENSQDSRSECRGREKLHSIISKISGSVTNGHESEEMGDESESDSGFEIMPTEAGSFKRKSDRKGDARKLMKGSDGEAVEVQFQREQGLSSSQEAQVLTDLPPENPFSMETPSTSLYSDIHMQALSQQQELEDSDDAEIMPQVALGLVRTKHPHPLLNAESQSLTYIPAQFVRKLEELENQVKVLQNKNQVLEESYKKLSDLVEAQNHLLTSGSPAVQRVSVSQSLSDASGGSVPVDTNVSGYGNNVQSQSVTMSSATPSLSRPVVSAGTYSYELPRRVSAKDVLHLWERGNEDFPPLKDWTPTQKLKQQSKISRWKKLVDIFKNDYKGDMKVFEESFSDTKGEILPITTILSLYETQQTPAFLTTITPSKYEPHASATGSDALSSLRDKVFSEPDHRDLKTESKLVQASETLDYDENPTDIQDEHIQGADRTSSVSDVNGDASNTRFQLPRKVGPRDIVQLWEHGCEQFPPVSQWTRAQKIGQETKVFRWKKIVEIFKQDCGSDWTKFECRYSNERGQPLAISAIIYKFDIENTSTGPIFERKYSDPGPLTSPREQPLTSADRGLREAPESVSFTGAVKVEKLSQQESATVLSFPAGPGEEPREVWAQGHTQLKSPLSPVTSPLNSPSMYILPRKVTAKDIIRMWEEGSGDMPPLCHWTPTQKAGQRSKFSRWAKIYDIFKYYCKGDMKEFEAKFSDERGELLPVTTIVAMYEARETSPGMAGTLPNVSRDHSSSEAVEGEIFQLPRKVTAKDVVHLWENGCEYFPPVCKWPKIHKVGHETKLFRWKKTVDIFRKDCGGSWEKFEQRFSNARGELLPISAILAKYDLENEAALPYYRIHPSSSNGTVLGAKLVAKRRTDVSEGGTQAGREDSGSDSSDEQGQQTDRSAAFILPKKVSALDVIYFWENGLGDMPPICQWSPAEKATQRSKVSRWNKIVDIFKYECGGDIRQFEEKYKDERGELMPITTILNLHDAQHAGS